MNVEVRKYNKIIKHFNPSADWTEVLSWPTGRCTGKSLAQAFVFVGFAMQSPGQKRYVFFDEERGCFRNKGIKLYNRIVLPSRQQVEYFWHLVEEVINKQGLVGFTINRRESYLVYNPIGEVEVSTQTVYTVKE